MDNGRVMIDKLKVLQVIFSILNSFVVDRFNKLILICVIILFQFNLFPQSEIRNRQSAVNNLVLGIEKIISDPFFNKTQVAIDIFDLTDSISLYKKNEKLLLRPASNMKLLTSIAALENLGEYFSFRTGLYYAGIIAGETLYGDLFIVGGFDPLFKTDELDYFVSAIKSLGIKNIVGGIYADISRKDSMYWGKGWMWDDDPEPSAPYLSALNINGNTLKISVRGSEFELPAIVEVFPNTNYVDIVNNSITVGSADDGDLLITRDWVNRRNTVLVYGKVLKNSSCRTCYSIINLMYPERYFLTLFKEQLEQEGIYIDKSTDVKRLSENAVHLSTIHRPIDTVLVALNKDSDNLSGEMLIYAMAYEDSGAPAAAADGLAAVKRLIDSLGFDSANYSVADGSGVSHYNLISAELILSALKYVYYNRNDLFTSFYNSLAVAGVDGTLKNRMKNTLAQGNIHAKTGTLNGVSNLSGYVTAKNGHFIAFSILIQNYVEDSSVARGFQNKICELLAEFE